MPPAHGTSALARGGGWGTRPLVVSGVAPLQGPSRRHSGGHTDTAQPQSHRDEGVCGPGASPGLLSVLLGRRASPAVGGVGVGPPLLMSGTQAC